MEVKIYKIINQVEETLKLYPEFTNLFEDESGATVQADIALQGQYLGVKKKVDPLKQTKAGIKKLKKKRKF